MMPMIMGTMMGMSKDWKMVRMGIIMVQIMMTQMIIIITMKPNMKKGMKKDMTRATVKVSLCMRKKNKNINIKNFYNETDCIYFINAYDNFGSQSTNH